MKFHTPRMESCAALRPRGWSSSAMLVPSATRLPTAAMTARASAQSMPWPYECGLTACISAETT